MDQKKLFEAESTIYENRLAEKYAPYMEGIKAACPTVDEQTLKMTAKLLDNLNERFQSMDETTKSSNFGSFIHHGFELISAIMPNLISPQVVSVQPQSRRIGEIFFMEFLYGSNKGSIKAGEKMFSAFEVGNENTNYTTETIEDETIGTGTGSKAKFDGNFSYIPIIAGTITISVADPAMTVTDDGEGNLIGDIATGTNTIDYDTGEFDVTFKSNVAASEPVLVTYDTSFESNPDNIPEVDIRITSQAVTAQVWKLRAKYLLDASYDAKQHFGKDTDTELLSTLASEVRMEQDSGVMKDLLNQCSNTATPTEFDLKPPFVNVSFRDHKFTFIDTLLDMSNSMFHTTRRAEANVLVVGKKAATVVESLENRFKKEGSLQPGPHYIGMLDDLKVFKNPFYPEDAFLSAYRGSLWIEAGYVWAPYLLLYTTPVVMLDDFVARRGVASMAGKKMINNKFYVRGKIVKST